MDADMAEPPLFDPSELDPISLEVWRDFLGRPVEPTPMTVSDLYGFGHICMFEGSGVPEAVTRHINELDPERHVAQYMDAVRRVRAPKPTTS